MNGSRLYSVLALAVAACAPSGRTHRSPANALVLTAADTAMVRRLCAAPDSVLAGQRSCELRDQRPTIKVF